jgi:hypothetical protein
MPRARIQLSMDDADFGYLTTNSHEWAAIGSEWAPQIADGRFRPAGGGVTFTTWKRAYWLEDGYAALMLARAFLDAWGHDYQIVSDETEGGGWVILTDYEWKQEGTS